MGHQLTCLLFISALFVFYSFQLLHTCIEGWGNWRWSEPFSVDNAGTFIRTIQYKGRTASLIIKIQQLSGIQKQVSKKKEGLHAIHEHF